LRLAIAEGIIAGMWAFRSSLCAVIVALVCCAPASADKVTVFAASSMQDVLAEIGAAFESESGHDLTIAYAGSSLLARQIDHGAPAAVFISANAAWMDELEKAGLLAPGTRFDIAANRLVVIALDTDPIALDHGTMTPESAIAALPEGARLAVALTEAVPAGIYARQALVSLGLWEKVRGRLAEAAHVRAALLLVARGEARAGIVYASDAEASPHVRVVAEISADRHEPIRYPVAIIAQHNNAAARAFHAFLRLPQTQDRLRAHGFSSLSDP